jgi:hypothetical protein
MDVGGVMICLPLSLAIVLPPQDLPEHLLRWRAFAQP